MTYDEHIDHNLFDRTYKVLRKAFDLGNTEVKFTCDDTFCYETDTRIWHDIIIFRTLKIIVRSDRVEISDLYTTDAVLVKAFISLVEDNTLQKQSRLEAAYNERFRNQRNHIKDVLDDFEDEQI